MLVCLQFLTVFLMVYGRFGLYLVIRFKKRKCLVSSYSITSMCFNDVHCHNNFFLPAAYMLLWSILGECLLKNLGFSSVRVLVFWNLQYNIASFSPSLLHPHRLFTLSLSYSSFNPGLNPTFNSVCIKNFVLCICVCTHPKRWVQGLQFWVLEKNI